MVPCDFQCGRRRPQPESAPARLQFGPFECEEIGPTLSKHGTAIRLKGKPLQILAVLISRQGQIVSREELQHHLWQGTTFVDFEQGLNSAVNKLRQALSDSSDQPRFIETAPGKGYRFVAPVQSLFPTQPVEPPGSRLVNIAPQPPKSRGSYLLIIVSASIVLASIIGFWAGGRSRQTGEAGKPVRFVIPPPAGFSLEGAASRQAFALSPDGTRPAFTATDSSGESTVLLLVPHQAGHVGVLVMRKFTPVDAPYRKRSSDPPATTAYTSASLKAMRAPAVPGWPADPHLRSKDASHTRGVTNVDAERCPRPARWNTS